MGLPHLLMKAGGAVHPASHETVDNDEHYVYQEGRAVYKHAVTDMLTSSENVMARNGLTVDTIDYFIPHQANLRIIEAIADRMKLPRRETAGQYPEIRQHECSLHSLVHGRV